MTAQRSAAREDFAAELADTLGIFHGTQRSEKGRRMDAKAEECVWRVNRVGRKNQRKGKKKGS